MRASALFGNVSGRHSCYLCGCGCANEYKTKEFIKSKFTNRDIAVAPFSDYVCLGCVRSMLEKTNVTLADGEIRENQRARSYSWVLTESEQIAATKAHLEYLRNTILDPPVPPFAIILADSGQKHLIFRSIVNYSRDKFTVSLEESLIDIDVTFSSQLKIVDQLSAALSKKHGDALMQSANGINKLFEYYGEDKAEELIFEYDKIKWIPSTAVAWWLALNKELAQNEYSGINARVVASKNSGGQHDLEKTRGQRSLFN